MAHLRVDTSVDMQRNVTLMRELLCDVSIVFSSAERTNHKIKMTSCSDTYTEHKQKEGN